MGQSGTMTTPTTGIETAPRGKSLSTRREGAPDRVDVTVVWRGEGSWAPCPSEGAYSFRCLGMRFGRTRFMAAFHGVQNALILARDFVQVHLGPGHVDGSVDPDGPFGDFLGGLDLGDI